METLLSRIGGLKGNKVQVVDGFCYCRESLHHLLSVQLGESLAAGFLGQMF